MIWWNKIFSYPRKIKIITSTCIISPTFDLIRWNLKHSKLSTSTLYVLLYLFGGLFITSKYTIFISAQHLLHAYLSYIFISMVETSIAHIWWHLNVQQIHGSGQSIFSKSDQITIIKDINTKYTCIKRIMDDGGFTATKFLEQFRPCVVILFIYVQYGKIFQRLWIGVRTVPVNPCYKHILYLCPVKITCLWIVV